MKSFVEHYLSLGVKHIACLGNNSTDGTVEALMNYENVTVLRTKLPYKAGPGGFECLFKQYLIACVVLDGYLREQAKQAVREEQYYENSAVYKKCLKVLDSNPSLQLKKETAREIKTVTDLVENEFLVVSDDYVGWVNG